MQDISQLILHEHTKQNQIPSQDNQTHDPKFSEEIESINQAEAEAEAIKLVKPFLLIIYPMNSTVSILPINFKILKTHYKYKKREQEIKHCINPKFSY